LYFVSPYFTHGASCAMLNIDWTPLSMASKYIKKWVCGPHFLCIWSPGNVRVW